MASNPFAFTLLLLLLLSPGFSNACSMSARDAAAAAAHQ